MFHVCLSSEDKTERKKMVRKTEYTFIFQVLVELLLSAWQSLKTAFSNVFDHGILLK